MSNVLDNIEFDPYKLTISEWHELIDFYQIPGQAWRKSLEIKWFKDGAKHTAEHTMKWWNSRFAGKAITRKQSDGYVEFHVLGNKRVLLHHVIWFINTGKWPENQIDHINGIRDDNRFENLREVTNVENSKNQKRACNNKSGTTGVFWYLQTSKWCARISDLNGKRIHLGYFDNYEDAVAVRKAAEVKYGYHPNHGMR